MTLQQKLLAKKSKKGFTLVELVVVIAILAILAAIAIPMVVNIIQSASNSSGASNAATLSQQCKNVYAGVKSGAINKEDSKNSDGTAITWAAAKASTATAKQQAANAVTVAQVMTYSGLNFDISADYYFCTGTAANSGVAVGDIVYSDTGSAPTTPTGVTYSKLATTTKLGGQGGLYKSGAAAAQTP